MISRILPLIAIAFLPVFAADWVDLLPPATPLGEKIPGWTRIPIPAISGVDPRMQWTVDGAQKLLICAGTGGHEWLRYDKELTNFVLQVDWRFTPKEGETKYNSGIGIRMSRFGEIWYQAQTGLAGGWLFGNNFTDGSLKSFTMRQDAKENRIKPAGEWNTYEIRAIGDKITLSINGAVINELTGVGMRRGYIGLEAEGFEIAFRNIKLQALE